MLHYKTTSFWQATLVWLLFLGSVATLFFNSLTALSLPGRELQVREQLREASLKLVAASLPTVEHLASASPLTSNEVRRQFEELTSEVLKHYPGVEGGFYLAATQDAFTGYAFPTEAAHGPRRETRREPPPKEEPYIRSQARQTSLQDESEPVIQVRDVGPSRVVVATAAVGSQRPAEVVVWSMYRVTGPEQHRQQVYRYQISTLLALGGIAAALLLTLNLRRTLRKERQSRERLHDELRRSEHLASLGLLVAQLAHEIRNPLAGIRSTVQLWQRLPAASQTPESMQAVVTAVDRLDSLLSNFLRFSRSEASERILVDLNQVVRETAELVRAEAAQQHVRIELHLDSQLPTLLASATGLRQVLLNLAKNGLQAMSQSGELNFRTRWQPEQQLAELEIADTGTGIDPNVRSRLFEPFFTTRAQGTGLGLALCREIILQHGGSIELHNAVPHGTRCLITIPIHDPLQSAVQLA